MALLVSGRSLRQARPLFHRGTFVESARFILKKVILPFPGMVSSQSRGTVDIADVEKDCMATVTLAARGFARAERRGQVCEC